MDQQDTRLARLSALERQMHLPAQWPEVAPAAPLARAEVFGQVAPEGIRQSVALPVLLVLPLMILSPFIYDLLSRLWALFH